MLQVSEKEIEARLRLDNPWWDAEPLTQYSELPRRAYLKPFSDLIHDHSVNRAVVLLGPRRVGKTVMVHHAIHQLLEQGVEAGCILYLSLDTPVYTGLGLEKIVHFHAELQAL
ncbi:MAG TPA: ATP-binding protein, partial [Gammaproteobacteria bacterium]|nr:ATP-binding protein [Gammaproteobacteria bacterium]